MKLLLFDMGSFTFRDFKGEIERQGHFVDTMYYHFKDRYFDTFFEERIRLQLIRNVYDAVISINFFPLIAVACWERGILYISWSYDSPLDERLYNYFAFETNRIFLFDREEVKECNQRGFANVFHLPLAINVDRLEKLSLQVDQKYRADISFVGQIYESNLAILLLTADDYVKGYVEGVFQSQLRIYGHNFLEKVIPEQIIDSLNKSYVKIGQNSVKLSKRGLAYAIATQITHFERSFLLDEMAEKYDVHVYTANKCKLSKKVHLHGPVKYYTEMNLVFFSSKINLCPTLKSISSGIPLRALDILGAGGVLLSNYQQELAEYFVDGEDVIMYDGIEDAFEKVEFFLRNGHLLPAIARRGHEKAKKYFGYDQRVKEILRINL